MSTTPHVATTEVTPPYARVGRTSPGRSRRIWLVAGVLVVCAAAWFGLARVAPRWRGAASGATSFTVRPMDLPIVLSEDGELKPVQSTEIRNEVEGQATIVWVIAESTRVKKGDLLIELASDELKERLEREQIDLRSTRASFEAAEQDLAITRNENASKLKKAEIDKAVAELELQQYVEGDYEKAKKAAEIDIKQTEMDIERKEEEIRKSKRLLEREFITPAKMEQLVFELEKAQMTLEKNKLALKILENYEKPKNETQKRSAVEQATQELEREHKRADSRERQAVAKLDEQRALLALRETRVKRLEEQLAKCKVFAPTDGVVQYPDPESRRGEELPLAVGQQVRENELLLVLPNTQQMMVTTRVHEADRHMIVEGLRCEVRVPAVPNRVFSGRIAKVARFADSANRWLNPNLKEHAAEVLLDDFDAALSPGDSADVKILVDTVPNVLTVPVQSVFTRGRKHFVFVRGTLKPQPTEVQLGRSNTQMIEVKGGISAGDVVLMHADEPLLAMLPSGIAEGGEEMLEEVEKPQQPQQQPGGERRGRGGRGGGGRADSQGGGAKPVVAASGDATTTESGGTNGAGGGGDERDASVSQTESQSEQTTETNGSAVASEGEGKQPPPPKDGQPARPGEAGKPHGGARPRPAAAPAKP